MDGHFGRLPVEVQERIFDSFSGKADLLECQLTCKLWNKHSTRALYKRVIFDYTDIEKAHRFIKTLNEHGKDLTTLVEHVELSDFFDSKNQPETSLKFFLDNCPNIRTYRGETVDESYLKGLNFENWKHLEKFAFFFSDKSKQFIEIAKQHKATIKELKLHESIIPTFCDNKQDIKEKLIEFKSLEKIIIRLEHFCHLSSLDNMIPENVKSLKLDLEDPRFDHGFVDVQETVYEEETIAPQDIDLRKINPCPNIKELELEIPLGNEVSFKYLMHKFPKLEKLSYRSKEIIFVSEDTREAFTDYLLSIKNTDVTYTLVCSSDGPMDYFLIKKLVESIRAKDSKKQCNFNVSFSISDSFINKMQVDKETNNGVESYRIVVGLEDSQKLDFLKSFGADLTELNIGKSDDDGLDLNEIFKHCSNLKYLDIEEFDNALSEEVKENTRSLERLKYDSNASFTPEIFSEWSKHFPNLTDLIFSSSEDIVIDLSSIITAFPNLGLLKMKGIELLLSNIDKKNYSVESLSFDDCKLPSNDFFSDLSCYLPNVCGLVLRISAEDLNYSTLILDMPETSFRSLFISVRPSYHRQSPSLFKISLSVGDIETDSNKQYYLGSGYLRSKIKRCTKAEYESVTEDSNVFELIVNCKELPIIVKFLDVAPSLFFEACATKY